MVSLQQLKYFCILAKELHFTRAAEALHITQPTLSYAIVELQKEIGADLFQKEGNKTALTKYGIAFLPYAEKALAVVDEGKTTIENMLGSDGGSVSVGYIYSVSFDFLPDMVSGFQAEEKNRDVSFNFYQGIKDQIIRKLNEDAIDLAFASCSATRTIKSIKLFSQELFLVVPNDHHLAGKKSVALIEVKDEPFIFDKPTSGLRVVVDRFFREAGIDPKIAYEVEECNAMAAFVSSKQGIAIMPKIPLMNTYDISTIKVTEPFLCRDISLLWKEARILSPVAERFKKFILVHGNKNYSSA